MVSLLSTKIGYESRVVIGILFSIKISLTFLCPFNPFISILSPSFLFLKYSGNLIFLEFNLHTLFPSVSHFVNKLKLRWLIWRLFVSNTLYDCCFLFSLMYR